MQKRSHKLLAATLLENTQGFQARRFELAFLFGSFQPDCNPLTYLKGSLRAYKFRGHNYSNSQHYIYSRISRLQRRQRWTIWQYYTLGKLTHYLADAFTYPHNENYPDSMLCHHQYETDLRAYLEEYLATRALRREKFRQDVADALQELHRQYMAGVARYAQGCAVHPEGHLPADGRLPACQRRSGCLNPVLGKAHSSGFPFGAFFGIIVNFHLLFLVLS